MKYENDELLGNLYYSGTFELNGTCSCLPCPLNPTLANYTTRHMDTPAGQSHTQLVIRHPCYHHVVLLFRARRKTSPLQSHINLSTPDVSGGGDEMEEGG